MLLHEDSQKTDSWDASQPRRVVAFSFIAAFGARGSNESNLSSILGGMGASFHSLSRGLF